MPRHDEEGHRNNLLKYLREHSTPDGTPNTDVWRQGMMDYVQLDVDASVLWNPIGPAPLQITAQQQYQGTDPDSGEVTDIAIDPDGTTDQTMFIATNDGGIWRTQNGGLTWEQTMDDLLGLSMGAVAIDPSSPTVSRVIYAGTGNMYDGGSEFTKGVGLYRSSDGGATWNIVDGGPFATIFAGAYITGIAVPAQDRVLVATNNGLYLSVDGGQDFGSNSPNFDNAQPVVSTSITCLLLDAASPATTVYIAVAGQGVFKSTDAGATFPTNLFTAANGAPQAPLGNIEVAQSELNPQVLYASVQSGQNPNAVYSGLFQSINGGQNWTLLPSVAGVASADGFAQTDYDLTLGIDPVVAVSAGAPGPPPSGLIYVGFQELWRSQNGGQVFTAPACTNTQVHWDNHVIRFSPAANRVAGSANAPVYIGTDGGIAKSTDGGTTWHGLNSDIGTNLFFSIDIGKGGASNPPNKAYTYGGCQDTGTSCHLPADVSANSTTWHASINGDGRQVAVDPTDPTWAYGFDDGLLIQTSNAGTSWSFIGNLPKPSNFMFASIALEQGGNSAPNRTVYVGIDKLLYQSTNAGAIFASIPALSPPDKIVAVTTTSVDPKRIWVAAFDGSVHYSADAGATWDQGSFQSLPYPNARNTFMYVTAIAVDPITADRVAVAYAGLSGIHSKYRTCHVFLTTDSGLTWNDISGTDGSGPNGNLPDLPYHSVVFDKSANPPAIIVACDGGVMRCTNATVAGGNVTATWKAYGVGLPTVSCSSLAIDNSVNPPVLRVGTYGRSCFEVTHATGPQIYVGPNPGFGAVPVGGSGTLAIYVYNYGDAALTVSGINIAGSASFALNPAPAFPVTIAPAGTQAFSLVFSPTAAGDQVCYIAINNNGGNSPYALSATGRGVAAKSPRLATNPASIPTIPNSNATPPNTDFGPTTNKNPRSIPLQLFNVGTTPLAIQSINQSGSSDFSLSPAPVFPINIAAGGQASVTISYTPTSNGQASATFQIASNDPLSPSTLKVQGTGNAVSGALWPYILLAIGLAAVVGGVIAYEEFKK